MISDVRNDIRENESETRIVNLGFLTEAYEENSSPFLTAKSPGRRILIVEDDDEIRSLMVAFLEAEGYNALSCGDSLQALQVFHERNDIELVISDVNMPRMLGSELAQILATLRPDMPVFLVSGAEPADHLVELLRRHPQWRFFHKPFFLPELLKAVHEIMDTNLSPAVQLAEQVAVV